VAAGGGLKPLIACSVIGAGANSKAGGKRMSNDDRAPPHFLLTAHE